MDRWRQLDEQGKSPDTAASLALGEWQPSLARDEPFVHPPVLRLGDNSFTTLVEAAAN